MDLARRMAALCYDKNYTDDKRHKLLADVADTLRQFEACLIKYGPFSAGTSVTYIDFLLQDTLEVGACGLTCPHSGPMPVTNCAHRSNFRTPVL